MKRREDIEGQYERGHGKVRAEQILARDGKLNRRGGYALGVWRLSDSWEALARTDWLTAHAGRPGTTSIAYVAGVNLFALKHVKIGFDAGVQRDRSPARWGRVLLAQLMPYF